jgi:hypothetical protein
MPAPGDTAARVAVGDKPAADSKAPAAGNTMTTPDGRTITLPPGVTEERVRTIFAKFRSGGELTSDDRAVMAQMRALNGAGQRGGGAGRQASQDTRLGGSYIVFALRNGQPTPVKVRTGITDLDYSEVVAGLSEGDSVLILPSASLVQSQADLKERVNRMTGGGIPGMKSSTSTSTTPARN